MAKITIDSAELARLTALAAKAQGAAKVTLTPVESEWNGKPTLRFRDLSAPPEKQDAPWIGAFSIGINKVHTILNNLSALQAFAAKHPLKWPHTPPPPP